MIGRNRIAGTLCARQGGGAGLALIVALAMFVGLTPVARAGESGACCFGDGGCEVISSAECDAANGIYEGDGSECTACPTGACCVPGFLCDDSGNGPACLDQGGEFLGFGSVCAEGGFVSCTEACCLTDGSCQDISRQSCLDMGGAPQGTGSMCFLVNCPQACCLPGGGCEDADPIYCDEELGGIPQGPGTTCQGDACVPGACCLPDGTCLDDILAQECDEQGGEFGGSDTYCGKDVDCPTEACCLPADGMLQLDDGFCQDLIPSACTALGGTPQGQGSSCQFTHCPEACCFPDGTCEDGDPIGCDKVNGIPQGPGSTCEEVHCIAGACCLPDTTCEVLTPDACTTEGGAYQGDASACEEVECVHDERGDHQTKGSLVVFSSVEVRWAGVGPAGPNGLILDTFLSLTNDFPDDVDVQLYFVNGDPPLAAAGGERAHPGWNWVDNRITLTGDQPTYWSAATGLPAAGGLSPFTALDPGFPPGRPAGDGSGDRVIRGFVLAWAVDAASGDEVRWNHLKGEGTIVNYLKGSAWEYGTFNVPVVAPVANGMPTGTPGVLHLDGVEYAQAFDQLLLDFQAYGSSAFSGPRLVVSDTQLTLQPLTADLRQESDGPVTTKASFDVWNMNEVKFSGMHRCITCWDQTLISMYDAPNHFRLENLQTDHGKARINGLASHLCDVDFDPNNNEYFPFPPGPGDPIDPNDVISTPEALVGIVVKLLTFDAGADEGAAGTNLIGLGYDATPVIQYDVLSAPPEMAGGTKGPSDGATERRRAR